MILTVNLTLIWWCLETPLTVWLCERVSEQVWAILWAGCRGTHPGLAAVWMLAASLSHLAGSSGGWSVLTQTMWTCIPCSAPCLLRAYTLSTRGEPNSHTDTLQIPLHTHREVMQGSGFHIVSSSRRLYVSAVAAQRCWTVKCQRVGWGRESWHNMQGQC